MNLQELHIYKSLYRQRLRAAVRLLPESLKGRKSRQIAAKLISSRFFKNVGTLMVYSAQSDEVDTTLIIKEALKKGKHVFLPRVESGAKNLKFYRVWHPTRGLVRGKFGVLEPRPKKSAQGSLKDLELIIVPGIGFDFHGNRLGRGAGYYDRFLGKAKTVCKVGIAFREQRARRIPAGSHDIKMDCVITD